MVGKFEFLTQSKILFYFLFQGKQLQDKSALVEISCAASSRNESYEYYVEEKPNLHEADTEVNVIRM